VFKGFVRKGELRRWAPWIGVALVTLLTIALETGMESVCWDEGAAKAAKVNEAAGCFEFWFNRYQTLIGAVAALAAAGVAWIGVRRQIAKADEQISVASRQSAIAILPVLDERTKNAIDIHSCADATLRSGVKLFLAAQDAFEKAEALRLAYVSGYDVGRMVDVFDASVEKYKSEIEALSGLLATLLKEHNSGLAGPALRRACLDFWGIYYLTLSKNELALPHLERCAGNRFRDNNEIVSSFAAIKSIDVAALRFKDSAIIGPLNATGRQADILQNERDSVFDRSRS